MGFAALDPPGYREAKRLPKRRADLQRSINHDRRPLGMVVSHFPPYHQPKKLITGIAKGAA
jgi:hypothetical protein